MKDLASEIYRQRLIIEGKPLRIIDDKQIKEYLLELSSKLNMKTLIPPVTHKSDKFGWAGWIHWDSSGAHFYAWEKPFLFFSVDIYTCKKFDVNVAIEFTKSYFKAKEVAFKSV
ncbi:S-adenosylmethionine decarboxylase [Candidatus Pacearchaeota archaeon]|nr:S-adenosylmethionine decarboxylase [Candidatus Pacearchaeota archaeon]